MKRVHRFDLSVKDARTKVRHLHKKELKRPGHNGDEKRRLDLERHER